MPAKTNFAETGPDLPLTSIDSPEPMFFTAPSSPLNGPTDEIFPMPTDFPVELDPDDQSLTTLEKIYLFSTSQVTFHRVFISHAFPKLLQSVAPHDAVQYVLPLLTALAIDEEEQVKEAFVPQLTLIIWWFISNCQLIPVDANIPSGGPPTLCVDAFTPILGTLLLSRNSYVNGPARFVVVDLLQRIRRVNQLEDRHHPELIERDPDLDLPIGLFGREERALLESEILSQVVIGIGRLDFEPDEDAFFTPACMDDNSLLASSGSHFSASPNNAITERTINPYFPPISPNTDEKLSYSPGLVPGSLQSDPASSTKSLDTPASSSDNSNPLPNRSNSSPSPDNSSQDLFLPASTNPPLSKYTHGQDESSLDSFHAQALLERSSITLVLPVNDQSKQLASSLNQQPSVHHISVDNLFSEKSQELSPSPALSVTVSVHTSYSPNSAQRGLTEQDIDLDREQAAVGRLSSMSLMAALTASGCVDDSMKQTFVNEVERVAKDPVYWVRREACFALGALAKVVPQEIVSISLVPLLRTLLSDSSQDVRTSSLFALPAILSRLPPKKRGKLALDIILPMSIDASADVRQRVSEALGEVIYTFHGEEEDEGGGPPTELVRMFLGQLVPSPRTYPGRARYDKERTILDPVYDSTWPLICAFNFPAVALVLGPSRWKSDLCETYLSLAANPSPAVNRSLAASIGEMAKIVGSRNAREDLLPVWIDVLSHNEEEVRLKALGCLEVFLRALELTTRTVALESLLRLCEDGILKGWRERELVAQSLKAIVELVEDSDESLGVVRGLLRFVLRDRVSAVREAGVVALPEVWMTFRRHQELLDGLRADVNSLSQSEIFRRRMTFVACQQSLFLPGPDGRPAIEPDETFWAALTAAASDKIIDVRIGVARLIGIACKRLSMERKAISGTLLDLASQLAQDDSKEVQSYVPNNSTHMESALSMRSDFDLLERKKPVSTFSRPPTTRQPSQAQNSGTNAESIQRPFSGEGLLIWS